MYYRVYVESNAPHRQRGRCGHLSLVLFFWINVSRLAGWMVIVGSVQ
jgi:hypothetical protein